MLTKRTIFCGVGAAFLGIGLLWFIGNGHHRGIEDWETLNTSMERTLAAEKKDKVPAETVNKAPSELQTSPSHTQNLEANSADQEIAAQALSNTATEDAKLTGKVNVNTAEVSGLMELPGIGAKKAQAILDYRGSHGSFKSLSDLGKVKGIGPKMLEKLKPMVSF